jgi:DNA-binding CsgD family transcriptional regulator
MDTTIRLTARETELLQLLARGCTYIQVGDRLRMSVHTVESHVKNVYRKLNVHSARAAVWRATELRLLGDASDIGVARQAQPLPVYR